MIARRLCHGGSSPNLGKCPARLMLECLDDDSNERLPLTLTAICTVTDSYLSRFSFRLLQCGSLRSVRIHLAEGGIEMPQQQGSASKARRAGM
jgi:hypothetical protein